MIVADSTRVGGGAPPPHQKDDSRTIGRKLYLREIRGNQYIIPRPIGMAYEWETGIESGDP